MAKSPDTELNIEALRKLAEKKLALKAQVRLNKSISPLKLQHELEVQQVQLEMQNEALIEAKIKLDASVEHYSALYDFAPTPYLTTQRNGSISHANLTAATFFGQTRTGLCKLRLGALITAENLPLFNAFLEEAFVEHKKSTCETALLVNNNLLSVILHSTYDPSSDALLIEILDITKRKQAEDALRLSASVFTNALEAISITDANGIIIDINENFVVTTGYSREEAIGKNSRIMKSGKQSPEYFFEMWQSLLNKGTWSGELWNRRKNGELYVEMKTISAVRDAQGYVTHYVGLGTDITTKKKHQEQLEHIAHYDILTHLPNRSLLPDRLNQAMLQSRRRRQSLAVAFLDLDGFKEVNDVHGHDVGDELLIALSGHMQLALRDGDTLARIGGDEFVALLTDLDQTKDCEPILNRILLAASQDIVIKDKILKVSASIGVTLYPQDSADAGQLLRHADQAMYSAKQSGKNCYHFFDTQQELALVAEKQSIEQIQNALHHDQFSLHYQPQVNMRTGDVTGFEALIRWQHPTKGLLMPNVFLPVIESHPVSIEIGEWVLNTALTEISLWQPLGAKQALSLSINIGAVQLQHNDFVGRLTTMLAAHPDVDPHCLNLEIVETVALDNVDHTSAVIDACMALGINFTLDDFGTGYSSLTYLRRLPTNQIKIDQSFVRDMLIDPDDFAIVKAVIALAKSFNRSVVAEGVETPEQCIALLQIGCELVQGYGIASPMPVEDISAWLLHWRPDVNWQAAS